MPACDITNLSRLLDETLFYNVYQMTPFENEQAHLIFMLFSIIYNLVSRGLANGVCVFLSRFLGLEEGVGPAFCRWAHALLRSRLGPALEDPVDLAKDRLVPVARVVLLGGLHGVVAHAVRHVLYRHAPVEHPLPEGPAAVLEDEVRAYDLSSRSRWMPSRASGERVRIEAAVEHKLSWTGNPHCRNRYNLRNMMGVQHHR